MTALKRYTRLEAPGVWRPAPEAQRQDVIVAFRTTSLVLQDRAGRALAHWSLAAVARIDRAEGPALYTPSADAIETLEIADDTLTDAIETVRHAIAKSRPRRGRVRSLALAMTLVAGVAGAVWWLPGALVSHAVAVLPDPTREEIGDALFAALGRVSAGPCHSPRGDRALAQLVQRIGEETHGVGAGALATRARPMTWSDGAPLAGYAIVPDGIQGARHLPGGLVLIGRALVEDHELPEVLAGHLLAARMRAEADPPLAALLREAGPWATAQLLTTGHLPEAVIARHAETLLTGELPPRDDAALIGGFAAVDLPSTPFAYALDVTGESVLTLIEADPMRGRETSPLLSEADWRALQQICEPG
ncbi:MAG: hypothetical protein AAF865_07895 [Pseudomonadota bacterium]